MTCLGHQEKKTQETYRKLYCVEKKDSCVQRQLSKSITFLSLFFKDVTFMNMSGDKSFIMFGQTRQTFLAEITALETVPCECKALFCFRGTTQCLQLFLVHTCKITFSLKDSLAVSLQGAHRFTSEPIFTLTCFFIFTVTAIMLL